MDPITIAGLALSASGAISNIFGASKTNKANAAAIEAQQKMLAIQQQANRIDADRRRRALIRDAVIQRSMALARATNQGASSAGSSALPGAYGQIAGRAAGGISQINQNLQTSESLYAANQELFRAKLAAGNASMYSQIGSGLSSLGGALLSNREALGNIFGNNRGISYGTAQLDNAGKFYNTGAGAPYGY